MTTTPDTSATDTEREAMLDQIAELADRRDALATESQQLGEEVRRLVVQCAATFDVRKVSLRAAAMVSRPTIDAWLKAAEDSAQ